MSAKDKNSEGEEGDESTQVKILCGRDRRSRMYASIPVPQKGVDSDEYSTRRVLRFLEFLGYRDLVLKSDQEAALGKVLRHAKAHRGEGTQTMTEESPVKDSQSNGFIERPIQTIERQVRTLELALENCIGRKLGADSCVIPWLIEHAGNILSLFEVGSDS